MESVQVDFDQKRATVTTEAGRPLRRDEVEAALSSAGYTVTSFERDGPRRAGTAPPAAP